MTLRLPVFLVASLVLGGHAAYASPAATSGVALASQGLTDGEQYLERRTLAGA